jgi:hypothetical protein
MALFSNGRWTWPWIAVAVLTELSHRDRMDRLAAVRKEQEERTRDWDLEEGPDLYRLPLECPRLLDPTNYWAVGLIRAEADAARAERKRNAVLARERARIYG